VESFTTPGGSVGTSTRVALRVTYNEAGQRAGLPTELFAKLVATYRQRVLLGGAHVLDGETVFFTRLRPHIEMEAPQGYAGVVDERAWKSIVIMEDIAATKGAQFIEPIAPLTREQVEDLVLNLARMHGAMWEHAEISVLKTPRDHYNNVSAFLDMEKRCQVGMERAKSVIDPRVYGEAGRLWEGTRRALALATDELPRTLLHGDARLVNFAFLPDGRVAAFDWQLASAGPATLDLGYYLIGNARRRARPTEAVIARYRGCLEARLGSVLPAALWDRLLAAGVLYGAAMLLWDRALDLDEGLPGAAAEWDWWIAHLARWY
jgi:hypothetical protein